MKDVHYIAKILGVSPEAAEKTDGITIDFLWE